MSFASERQKLREQRQQKSTTITAGGTTPPAASKNSSASVESFASQRAKLREQRGNVSISEKVAKRVQALQQNQRSTSTKDAYDKAIRNAGRKTTSGGYYSRPSLGSASEKLYSNVTALEPVLAEKRSVLDTAQTALQQAESDVKTVKSYLDQAKAAYDTDPSDANANNYNQIVGAYNLAYESYAGARDAYTAAYEAYKPYEDELVNALTVYQLYTDQQQAAFDDWRGTIRDTGTIKADMESLDSEIDALESEVQTLKTLTLFRNDALGESMKQSLREAEKKLDTMKSNRALLQEEYDWSQYYQYNDLLQAEDFAEKSKYASTANGLKPALNKLRGTYTETGFDDLTYDYINRNEEARGKALVNSIGDNTALLGLDKSYLEKMTDEEISIFNYLYATQGPDAAYQYTAYLTGDLTQRQRMEQEAKWADWAKENPVGSSVFSTMISPMRGLSYLGQFADKTADGKIDQNAAYNKFSYIPSSIRGQVVDQIEASGKWGKVGSFAYQTGLSMADFLLASALTGNNQAMTLAIMGSGAAADTTISAKDRGLGDNQAFALGTIAGLAEAALESINMETVFNPDLLKEGILKYILKNAGAEGLEEVGTDIVNFVSDVLIAKDQSEWQVSINNYMRQGMTEGEAIARAIADQALTMMADFAGGAVSGGILSGTNAGIHVNYTNQMGNELGELDLDEEDIQAFIETGLESDPDTASYQLAEEIQAKIEAGETLSNYDLARLYQANMQAIQAEEENAEDIAGDTTAGNQTKTGVGNATEPSSLQLPALENDTQTARFVTQNGRNVMENQTFGTAVSASVPLSVAERLRQERNLNGGTQYGNEQLQGLQLGATFGEQTGGAGIPDGSGQWYDGPGTGEQTGILANGPERRRSTYADRGRATVARQNYVRSLRLEKVSSRDIGLQNGTEARNIQVVPQENWDAEMSQLADRIYNETGKGVTYVMGRIQIRGLGGAVGYARGVITGDRIIVQADHLRLPMEQIADHEAYHAKVDYAAEGRLNLNAEIKRHIVNTFSAEQFQKVLDKYIVGLRGVIDVNEARTGEEFEAAVRQIEEEIFADAYAGINAFGANADRFTSAVNEKMDQLYMGKIRNQENGTEEPTGPPEEHYSADDMSDQELEGLSLPSLDSDNQGSATYDGAESSTQKEYIKGDISTETVEADIQKVANMEPVSQITGEEFAKGEKDLITQVTEFFAELDNRAYNPQLGSITLDRQGVKSDIAHGIGRKKAAAFAAVPDVLARGYVVDYQKNWKGRGYDTAVVAAPVKIGNEEYLMGIVLNRNPPENKFYVHEVMTTENGASPFKTGTRKGNPSGNTPSVFSILDRIRAVKNDTGTQERFSVDDSIETKTLNAGALEHFGRTFSWRETGYLLTGGQKLDFSGRHEGASGGYRSVDHREIVDAYPEELELSGNEAMVDFMARGNIRIMPESAGINLQVAPTKAQENALDDFVSRNRGEVILDIDNAHGDTVASVEYPRGTRPSRVINDIRKYFADGTIPQISDVARFRYSVDDTESLQRQERKLAPKKIRPVAESRPLIAKRDLRNTIFNLFSIPSEQRADLGTMVDSYADRLIKNGSLTEEDRKSFFDRLYDSGVMTVPADEYFSNARSLVHGGRVYVSDRIRSEFGDDWNDIRRKAFGAGIYLTSDRNAGGIDMWNHELAEILPGLFDSEETDLRSILERIVQVAEEGKDEKLSLAEYTARLAEIEHQSEDEFLDNMERQMDWALRTFAEKARLEVHLRDRTGKKMTQEREKGTERMTRQRAKEAQRRADERQARKDSARRAKERRELRELQQRTLKQLQWLSKNRNRAPEELKETWDEVLGDIDLYAVSAADEMRWSDKHNATWKDLAQMYKDAMKNDPNFLPSKELERIVTRLDATKIADMDLGALQDLYKAAIGLRTEFYNRNNVINDEMQRLFAEVYTDAKKEIESAPGGFTGNVADKFLNLDQLTPMNVLQRMAGWDPDGAFYSMAKQLERGERDMRAYSVKAQKMLQDFLTEHEDWVKIADGQGKDAIWYEVEVPQLLELGMGDKPIFGPTVKVYMTPAQKVHMFLESKNLDNLRHMTGGRTFVNKDLYSQGKRQEALSQGRTIKLAPETVRKLVSDLTAEEMELARILDRYYNTFATQEINKVSNILYGYDKAMGKNYAPIYTNRNYTKTEFGVFDTTAEGVGNLKGRQYAVNPSYNISAFDAFERHVDQTARFCGMAIPARNWTTLMNWREKNNSTGDVITHKWGEESKRYISDLITTLQGGDDAKNDTISSGLSRLQSNYISAIFGANPSIVLKQLGSIPMASAYLDSRNIPSAAQVRSIDRGLISKYTQELEWRTMGYTTPETKQLKDNPNWTQTNKTFKFVFGGGAITAMDGWAASTLWPWAENKVRREHPELALGSKAEIQNGDSPFYKKVAEEFENAISRSQSVSDEIHQSSLRKSKSPFTRAFTMFRSDSAQTYNTLRQKIGEAQYYMRTGAKEKVIRTAKKAAGTAFVAMLINAAWSESINFLMALWKNKGKYYRDDEDEMTFGSVAGEMVSGMLGSFAGVVTFGEELFELIGNILTGDTWYGIETPGMEQLNDLLDTLIASGSGMRDLVAGGWDVLKNGGNLGEYFGKHSGQILGSIKDLAEAAAMYLPGLPASNLEAYLVGALKWVSPELGAAYDDLFSDIGKSDLTGMEGGALEGRIGSILSSRNISESDDTVKALAALYEAGYKTAIPSDTPTSVSIDGETQSLGEYQKQAYDTIWGGIVADGLDNMVASDSFAEADPKIQAKMLSNLYSYAAEQAKAELFDEYEMDSGAAKNAAIVAAGATVAECITWNTITSEMKSAEKAAELAFWDVPESAKREIFQNKISDSREDSIEAFQDVGLSFDQFLQAYSKYGEINNMDLKANEKAVEFSRWVNDRGYTAEQAAVVKDELTYFNMTPATAGRYDEMVGAGMDSDVAYDLTDALNELQPEDGKDEVSDLQRWRASVDFSDDVENQLTALFAVMTPAQFQKVEIANNFGVSPDAYVTLQEIKSQYDADGNGSYKNTEIQAAIDGMPGYCTTEQKAVLWQLATGSTSARNNPYSRQVGQKVLDARAAAKETAAQKQTGEPTASTDDSFSQEILNQLLGRW